LRRQVLRLRRGLRRRPLVARHRRSHSDGDQPLLIPRVDPRAVHSHARTDPRTPSLWVYFTPEVTATAISLYYYLAVIRALYMRMPAELQLAPVGGSPPREALLQSTVAARA